MLAKAMVDRLSALGKALTVAGMPLLTFCVLLFALLLGYNFLLAPRLPLGLARRTDVAGTNLFILLRLLVCFCTPRYEIWNRVYLHEIVAGLTILSFLLGVDWGRYARWVLWFSLIFAALAYPALSLLAYVVSVTTEEAVVQHLLLLGETQSASQLLQIEKAVLQSLPAVHWLDEMQSNQMKIYCAVDLMLERGLSTDQHRRIRYPSTSLACGRKSKWAALDGRNPNRTDVGNEGPAALDDLTAKGLLMIHQHLFGIVNAYEAWYQKPYRDLYLNARKLRFSMKALPVTAPNKYDNAFLVPESVMATANQTYYRHWFAFRRVMQDYFTGSWKAWHLLCGHAQVRNIRTDALALLESLDLVVEGLPTTVETALHWASNFVEIAHSIPRMAQYTRRSYLGFTLEDLSPLAVQYNSLKKEIDTVLREKQHPEAAIHAFLRDFVGPETADEYAIKNDTGLAVFAQYSLEQWEAEGMPVRFLTKQEDAMLEEMETRYDDRDRLRVYGDDETAAGTPTSVTTARVTH